MAVFVNLTYCKTWFTLTESFITVYSHYPNIVTIRTSHRGQKSLAAVVTGAEPGAALQVPEVQERLATRLGDNDGGASYRSSFAGGGASSRGVVGHAGAKHGLLSPSLRPPHAS